MKKVLPLILAIFLPAALASCDGDYDFKPRKYRFQTMPAPGEKQQAVPPEGALYITCAEFPEGYDYRTDPDYGSVEATLVLFADGSRITSLAAGPGSAFSIDPDMHRVRGGHLYTDGVDGNGTFFHRDGEKIFSYEGRESVRGFMVIDNKVHTLGQSRSGGGFSYRINGQLVFGRKEGYILGDMSYPSPEGGALRTDGEDSEGMPKIYFSYGIPRQTSEGTKWEYHLFRNGEDEIVPQDGATIEILDIVLRGGVMYRSEYRSGKSLNPVLVVGDSSYSLGSDMLKTYRPHLCRIFFDGDDVWLKGYCSNGSEQIYTLWNQRGIAGRLSSRQVHDLWTENGVMYFLTRYDSKLLIISGRSETQMSEDFLEDWSLPFNNCAIISEGSLLMALTDNAGQLVFYSGGEVSKYPLNGYPTSIYY